MAKTSTATPKRVSTASTSRRVSEWRANLRTALLLWLSRVLLSRVLLSRFLLPRVLLLRVSWSLAVEAGRAASAARPGTRRQPSEVFHRLISDPFGIGVNPETDLVIAV
ncbi:hypothetical protein Raf01_20630 [Rugosimonospora africana]|uniref:Uncharacterized protein n=1 Tax=Rugosimonospora africana TaxID=556532 RepID=A0A8J3QNW4_9ACTN|nr:hypothetical protein Raf01_20630 [Rugosimonospora africana]